MKAIGSVITAPFKAIGLIPSAKKLPAPVVPPTATRDDARARIQAEDELLRRRGGAADILTGSDGAEAGPVSAKQLLGN